MPHVHCTSCTCPLVVVLMCNLRESVHLALELSVLPLVQLWGSGSLLIQRICRRSPGCCLALTSDSEHLSISDFEVPAHRPGRGALWIIKLDAMLLVARVLSRQQSSWQPLCWAWFQWVSKSQGSTHCRVYALTTAVPKNSHSYPKQGQCFNRIFNHSREINGQAFLGTFAPKAEAIQKQ